jgi:hypothetical protein
MEVESRKILHCNVTAQPTAAWTLQQFREALPNNRQCELLLHDHDSIFSPSLDRELEGFGLRVLRTPVRAPQANVMPVMPDDEPFDYFATQAIADFLAAEGTPASEHNATNPFASTAEILTDLCGPLRYMSGQ